MLRTPPSWILFAGALAACVLPAPRPEPQGAPAVVTAPSATPATRAPARAALPALDREPLLGVLLARAKRVEIQLETRVELELGDARTALGPGTVVVEGVRLDLRGEPVLTLLEKGGQLRRLTIWIGEDQA